MKIALITFLLGAIPSLIQACSCSGSESFCFGVQASHHIVTVTVGEEIEPGIYQFPIVENLLNELDTDTILLETARGGDCNVSLHNFIPNDTMIFQLRPASPQLSSPLVDFTLLNCGIQFLYYKGGMVKGQIDFSIDELPYKEFTEMLETCGNSSEETIIEETSFLFPNPTANSLTLSSKTKITHLELFDMMGNQYVPKYELTNEQTARIDLADLPAGMYILKIYGSIPEQVMRLTKIQE